MDAYVSHAFNASVEAVFEEFKRGFFRVCDRDPVTLFRPEELQGLLVGQDVYEWAKLKQVHALSKTQARPIFSSTNSENLNMLLLITLSLSFKLEHSVGSLVWLQQQADVLGGF